MKKYAKFFILRFIYRRTVFLKKKLLTLLLAFCFVVSVAGCGKNIELDEYQKDMDKFFSEIEVIHVKMNSINPESETALDELFKCLDELDKQFKSMAALTVPKEFSNIENLADEASENMSLAVENYHNAYSDDSYNEYTAATADEYYKRANKRLQYMIDILHGEVPEGDDVIITETTE